MRMGQTSSQLYEGEWEGEETWVGMGITLIPAGNNSHR